jgi:signal transduction histidine kinase
VHDGVLQALALIHRRGAELGGPAAELAQLAGEQERVLRRLVSHTRGVLDEHPATRDVRSALGSLEGERVHMSVPAGPVLLPAQAELELVAAVAAALDNVAQHAGSGAHAWVLVEGSPREVVVTVRDNGGGMPDGRLDEAAGEGRLGVSSSIRGRLREIGGDGMITSRPGSGTTVRMTVPNDLPPVVCPEAAGAP